MASSATSASTRTRSSASLTPERTSGTGGMIAAINRPHQSAIVKRPENSNRQWSRLELRAISAGQMRPPFRIRFYRQPG